MESDEYLELLDKYDEMLTEARRKVVDVERSRRISAAIAVKAGNHKKVVAERLGTTRPTLDKWLELVSSTPEETARVHEFFRLVERSERRAAARQQGA